MPSGRRSRPGAILTAVERTSAEHPVTATPPLATGVAWDADAPGHHRFSVDRYTSQAVAERELERLWPRVWQIACSVDHVAEPGDWFEHRCGPLSVLIVRGDDGELRAFQNVCRHRGNLLCTGAGAGLGEIRCGFHNWSWTLAGELREVPSRRGFGALRNEDLPLIPARVGTWGPLVFVNLDADAAPLQDWLEGVPADLAWADLDEFRCGVTTTTPVSCNWKVTAEGFSETYHVQGLHPEMIVSFDDVHAAQHLWDRHAVSYQLYGVASPRLGAVPEADVWDSFCRTQGRRLGLAPDDTVPMPADPARPGATAFDLLVAAIRAHAARRGVDLSRFDDDQIMRLRQYNLFPNATVLVSADSFNVLVAKPSAVVDRAELFTLHFDRRPAGPSRAKRPTDVVNGLDAERLGLVFNQDVRAMARMQRGLSQPGFTHTIVSSEERRIVNTHRVLATYLDQPD